MGLLAEIQAGAISEETSLSEVLRRCLVLAYRLKNEPLLAWVKAELNGYPDRTKVPEYRVVSVRVKVNSVGIAHRITGEAVPYEYFPEELYKLATTASIGQAVGSLEATKDQPELHVDPPARVRQWVIEHGNPDVDVTAVYQELPPGSIRGILSKIRNRLLEFVLEIEGTFPDVESGSFEATPMVAAKAGAIFNTTIFGGSPSINVGDSVQVMQIKHAVSAHDFDSLRRYLLDQGLVEHEVNELHEILDSGEDPQDVEDEATPTGSWARKAGTLIAKRGGTIAFETAKQLVVKAVLAYAGLG